MFTKHRIEVLAFNKTFKVSEIKVYPDGTTVVSVYEEGKQYCHGFGYARLSDSDQFDIQAGYEIALARAVANCIANSH